MTVKEVRDYLNNVTDEKILDKEISVVLDDGELVDDILDWCIGEPSENYDPDDPDTEEYEKRNDAYYKICEMLKAPLTNIELRTPLFESGIENSEVCFVAKGFME